MAEDYLPQIGELSEKELLIGTRALFMITLVAGRSRFQLRSEIC